MNAEDLIGIGEIAVLFGVKRQTVDQWRHRGILPDPVWTISNRPVWSVEQLVDWAEDTGRTIVEDA